MPVLQAADSTPSSLPITEATDIGPADAYTQFFVGNLIGGENEMWLFLPIRSHFCSPETPLKLKLRTHRRKHAAENRESGRKHFEQLISGGWGGRHTFPRLAQDTKMQNKKKASKARVVLSPLLSPRIKSKACKENLKQSCQDERLRQSLRFVRRKRGKRNQQSPAVTCELLILSVLNYRDKRVHVEQDRTEENCS